MIHVSDIKFGKNAAKLDIRRLAKSRLSRSPAGRGDLFIRIFPPFLQKLFIVSSTTLRELLGSLGITWDRVVSPGIIRNHLEASRVSGHLGSCVSIWNPLGSSGIIWNHLGSSGTICERSALRSSKVIWDHLESSCIT